MAEMLELAENDLKVIIIGTFKDLKEKNTSVEKWNHIKILDENYNIWNENFDRWV